VEARRAKIAKEAKTLCYFGEFHKTQKVDNSYRQPELN
jgi:hypothetical protein